MELKIVKDPGQDDHEFSDIEKLTEANLWPFEFLSAHGMIPYLKRAGKDLVGIEIGVLKGENVRLLLDELTNIKTIYGVDPYVEHSDQGTFRSQAYMDQYLEVADRNLKTHKKKYKLVKKSSADAAADFKDESIDFVLLDGDHSYDGIKADIETYYPKLKKGGHIFVHDTYLPEVQKAMHDYRDENRLRMPLNMSKNYISFWVK